MLSPESLWLNLHYAWLHHLLCVSLLVNFGDFPSILMLIFFVYGNVSSVRILMLFFAHERAEIHGFF